MDLSDILNTYVVMWRPYTHLGDRGQSSLEFLDPQELCGLVPAHPSISPSWPRNSVFQLYWTHVNYYYISVWIRKLKINDLYKIIRVLVIVLSKYITVLPLSSLSLECLPPTSKSVSRSLQDLNELFPHLFSPSTCISTPLHFKSSLYYIPPLDREFLRANTVFYSLWIPQCLAPEGFKGE